MNRAAATAGTAGGIAALVIVACACPAPKKLGDPLDGLTQQESARFVQGREAFQRAFTPETGLGPLFNADGCAECHEDPATGGRGDEIESHVSVFDPATGSCDQLVEKGGPVIQQHATPALSAALGIDREPTPAAAKVVASRSAPELFGLGLLDAVPDAEILALADPDDRDHDGISGRPNRFVDGRLGRFGRKAFVPTLREFNAGAYTIEQGITNPESPTEESIGGDTIPPGVDPVPEPEITQAALDATDDFVRFLAPPQRAHLDAAGRRGRKLFGAIGCAACHVPSLTTGDSPVEALRYKTVYAYTDLLLHDMGDGLADICFGLATPSEFRTAPLMGISKATALLHDGRAKSIEEAIRLHAGEASTARNRFEALSSQDRDALLRFLGSL